jgi:hypothetical protein
VILGELTDEVGLVLRRDDCGFRAGATGITSESSVLLLVSGRGGARGCVRATVDPPLPPAPLTLDGVLVVVVWVVWGGCECCGARPLGDNRALSSALIGDGDARTRATPSAIGCICDGVLPRGALLALRGGTGGNVATGGDAGGDAIAIGRLDVIGDDLPEALDVLEIEHDDTGATAAATATAAWS